MTKPDSHTIRQTIPINSKFDRVGIQVEAISCANTACKEVSLKVWFGPGEIVPTNQGGVFKLSEGAEYFRLRPISFAKPQPESVPAIFANDYYEACKIRDASPKASATLSRRVLQGLIRSFAGIERKTLFDEIEALEKLSEQGKAPSGVNDETIEAMHSLCKVGNIGAHMKGTVDTIVDVDPDEAQALIELIELLFEEWYVARYERSQKLAKIKNIGKTKDEALALQSQNVKLNAGESD